MDQIVTIDEAFDVGTWVGRRQAFALIAGRCSAADAEILFEIREKKLFRRMEQTWEDFCSKRLGLTRSYVDRVIRQSRELGPNYSKLSSFTRIKPAEYLRQIAPAVTDDGLCYDGEVIALEPENAPKLAAAVEALRHDTKPEPQAADAAEQTFVRAVRAVRSAIAEFHRLQRMDLDADRRGLVMSAIESWAKRLDRIRSAAS